jgi:hypothetical protein
MADFACNQGYFCGKQNADNHSCMVRCKKSSSCYGDCPNEFLEFEVDLVVSEQFWGPANQANELEYKVRKAPASRGMNFRVNDA